MSKTIVQYRIWCNSEAASSTGWSTSAPTACINDPGYSLNVNSVVTVKEERGGNTNGNFSVESIVIDAPANATTTKVISWPYTISVFVLEFQTEDIQKDDVADIVIDPGTPIGSLMANAGVGDTTITVLDTVMRYANVGFEISLGDGTNTNDLGRIVGVDAVNSRLTMERATTHALSASSSTLVLLTVRMLRNYVFGVGGPVILGESRIGGSLIPANSQIHVIYQNNSLTEAKRWRITVESLY